MAMIFRILGNWGGPQGPIKGQTLYQDSYLPKIIGEIASISAI